jgi:hypothetical protein
MAQSPNSISGLILTLLATETAEYLHARSAILSRCRVETRQERDVAQGGNTINIPAPMLEMDPVPFTYPTLPYTNTYSDIQSINIPTIALTFNNHPRTRVMVNQLESRVAAGNFDTILSLAKPGILEGMVRNIDKSLIALYTGLSNTPVGTAGVALTNTTILNGIASLSANMVDPTNGDVHFITGDQVYWNQLPNISQFLPAYAVGDNRFIREGDVGQIYGLRMNYSQNITVTASSPVVTNNLMFQKDAFVIGFLNFEPAKKYAPSAAIDEQIYVDPNTGVAVRAQMYYDNTLQSTIYSVDCCFGVAVYMANRGVVVQC